VAPTLAPRFELATVPDASLRRDLQALAAVRGANLAWLPEATVLRLDGAAGVQYFSLLRNTAHKNVAHMFKEAQELIPAENTLTVVPGFIGAYPNAIYRVRPEELPALTAAVAALGSEGDYRKLADRYAVRRTNPGFWAVSDQLMDAYAASAPIEAGVLDYSRLENR
jgi:predicted amidohydrolase